MITIATAQVQCLCREMGNDIYAADTLDSGLPSNNNNNNNNKKSFYGSGKNSGSAKSITKSNGSSVVPHSSQYSQYGRPHSDRQLWTANYCRSEFDRLPVWRFDWFYLCFLLRDYGPVYGGLGGSFASASTNRRGPVAVECADGGLRGDKNLCADWFGAIIYRCRRVHHDSLSYVDDF